MNDKSQKPKLSMYIHIPFCQRKCAYCDFLSFDCKNDKIDAYVEALSNQIRTYDYNGQWQVSTIFFGGGTPSLLTPEQITNIIMAIRETVELSRDAEISIECNPGTLTEEKIDAYRAIGINRISLGVQSMDTNQLKRLGRIHNEKTVFDQYDLIREKGFTNINLDIMYGLTNQTLADLESQLDVIIKMNPEHISAYGLIVEEGTAYAALYEKNPSTFPDEELELAMYWLVHKRLTEAGYVHYEISNYAKPGFRCIHNETYWRLIPYIGFGLGASSYMNNKRFDMIDDLDVYISLVNNTSDMVDVDSIVESTKEKQMEEYMFLGLRLLEGIDEADFMNTFDCSLAFVYGDHLDYLLKETLLERTDSHIRLTPRGIEISNYVLSYFLLTT